MVWRRCNSLLRDEDLAYDATQEVYLKLFHYKDKLSDEYPVSLLYRMATNVCLNIIRKRDRVKFINADDMVREIASSEDLEKEVIQKEEIDQAFEGEREDTRLMAIMYYVDRLTYEEIGREMGMSKHGVRKRLGLFKKRLQQKRLS